MCEELYLNYRGQELNMGSGKDRCGGLFLLQQTGLDSSSVKEGVHMSKRLLIIILQIVRVVLILFLCFAGIIIGIVILAIMGIDLPGGETIVNFLGSPLLLFRSKIGSMIFLIIIVTTIFIIQNMRKRNGN
jgi:hypothetical protein